MSARSLVAAGAVLLAALPAQADYTENVSFTIRPGETSFTQPMNTCHLMLDRAGGRNRVGAARAMTRNGDGSFSITVNLAEGDYIYVFVANVTQYVDINDPNLNPDDVPDGNFFNDPHPRTPGYGGQYSTDNVLFVRDPNRPKFDNASHQPGFGALVTSCANVTLSVRALAGADGRALAGTGSAHAPRVEVQMGAPKGVEYTTGAITDPPWQDLAGVSFSGGTVSASWQNPPEGVHLVKFHVANDQGLWSDPLLSAIVVNCQNQPPVASAGGVRFAAVNQEVVLNGGMSNDPDLVGLASHNWRVISGPAGANVTWRDVDEEHVPRDGFGRPSVDEHGNLQGDPYPQRMSVPRFKTDRAGTYEIGHTVTDVGGMDSAEARTTVQVVQAFNAAIKVRLEPYVDGNEVVLDASLSTGPGANALAVFPDPRNPQSVTPSINGLVARFSKPSTPGFYLFHAQVGGNSYHRTAMLKVWPDGRTHAQDYGTPPPAWREDRVLYLGNVREFYDANGDGEGDFLGMVEKMAHIQSLGVNAMWLMPVTPGPTTHGYAATAQFDTEEDYGTVEQYELLIETARAFGIEVLMDLVANHTSAEHPYFLMAKANPVSPLRSWFSFNPDGSYRYAFNFVALPDVNTNSPLVRRNTVDMVRFWMERGVAGVRADIAGWTPTTLWEDVRYAVKSINPTGIMLAELIPPTPEFFDQRFDLAYDSSTFWALRDGLSGSGNLEDVDNGLKYAQTFFSRATSARVRDALRQRDLLWLRYVDNQDEDRFLLRAGNDLRRSRVAAGVLMTLPGVPLIYNGDEVGIAELRGRMPFGRFSSGGQALMDLYRKLVLIRHHNYGLRVPDDASEGSPGNSYIRINSNGDPGGGSVLTYTRFGGHQRFIVLANRADSTVIGTTVKFWPPAYTLTAFPEGTLKLVDHLDPTDQRSITKADLLNNQGASANVRGFTTKIYQVTRFGIPDADRDGVLDSYDRCVGLANADQLDSDGDDVGNPCDLCPDSPPTDTVNTAGCPARSGEPRRLYRPDGVLDDPDYTVAQAGGNKLHVSFNGQWLYVATEAAARGEDVFIVVSDQDGVTRGAPAGKAGQVAYGGIHLMDEGEDDTTDWSGCTGQARAATLAVPGRGYLEGTLNVLEEFGRVPDRLRIAALRYAGGTSGVLQSQVPAAVTPDNNVTSDEMYTLQLSEVPRPDAGTARPDAATPRPDAAQPADAGTVTRPDAGVGQDAGGTTTQDGGTPPRDAGSTRRDAARPVATDGDGDGDGLTDDRDNCVDVPNPDQGDYDLDGVGDACDACPVSMPQDLVDADGCAVGPPRQDAGNLPRPEPKLQEDRGPEVPTPQNPCGCRQTQGGTDAAAGVVASLLLVAWRARRRVSRRSA
jgi:glycosidase